MKTQSFEQTSIKGGKILTIIYLDIFNMFLLKFYSNYEMELLFLCTSVTFLRLGKHCLRLGPLKASLNIKIDVASKIIFKSQNVDENWSRCDCLLI